MPRDPLACLAMSAWAGGRIHRNNKSKVHESPEPDAVVLQDIHGVGEADLALCSVTALVGLQSRPHVFALVLPKPLGLLRATRRLESCSLEIFGETPTKTGR